MRAKSYWTTKDIQFIETVFPELRDRIQLAAAHTKDLDDAQNQWDSYSRMLSAEEIEKYEAGGYGSGLEMGAEFSRVHPALDEGED